MLFGLFLVNWLLVLYLMIVRLVVNLVLLLFNLLLVLLCLDDYYRLALVILVRVFV